MKRVLVAPNNGYGAVDNYVYESVRHFLRRRHEVQSRGTDASVSMRCSAS